MKKGIAVWCAVLLLFAARAVHSADLLPGYQNYVFYFAGIELLSTDKTLNLQQKAERYRRLCVVTGINGVRAKAMVNKYKNDPAGWQKLRTAVLDVLQKRG
jgi:hypothetical protein